MSAASPSDSSTRPRPADDAASSALRETGRPISPSDPTLEAPAQPDGLPPTQPLLIPVSLVGQTLGDFELVAELGRGGMGIVYKAKQQSLDRFVAVKMLLAEHGQNDSVLARFLTEARTAASLDHPNVVKVYQVGECAHGQFFAMEFIDGPTLEAVIDRKIPPTASAVAIMILVADAVHYAHTKGVIHRDLKPANVMLDRARRPVVMDFGIAKCIGKTSVTHQGAILGTPGYMPPEQAGEDLGRVGPHSDVYALGAILYSLLTGRPPFDEPTALKTILKVISAEPPPPIREFRDDVPAELEAICLKCLRKKPEERYASALDLSRDLRRFRAGKIPAAAAEMPPAKAPAPPPRKAGSTPTAAPPAVLIEQSSGKRIPLPHGTTIIGRASDCDVIVRSADVSKRHCQIQFLSREGATVEDLASINGTTLNGQPIERARLSEGDVLGVAGHIFKVSFAKA